MDPQPLSLQNMAIMMGWPPSLLGIEPEDKETQDGLRQ